MNKNKSLSILTLTLLAVSLASCDLFPQRKSSSKNIESDSSENSFSSSDIIDNTGVGFQSDYELNDSGWKKLIRDSYKYCEEVVEQGSVLLKNDNNALPLGRNERKVTLLGQGSKNLFMRSGAGGAAPNDNLVVTLDQAFEDNGFEINHTVFDAYNKLSNSDMTIPNTTVEHTFNGFYTSTMKNTFSSYGDAAIITIVRIGTENADPSKGKLDLNDDEKQLLSMVKEEKDKGAFKKVIVLINSPLAMSTDWVDDQDYGIDACLYVGVPGYYGAGGIVHILMGQDSEGNIVNPSGHTVNTFAASANSSPAMVNALNSSMVVYQEGVYVGYKYYETRYEDSILNQGNASGFSGTFKSSGNWNYAEEMGYPFGFGLSYTTFKQKLASVSYNEKDDTYTAKVEVTNIGNLEGKASIQLYVQSPYTNYDKEHDLGKSSISLMAYDKVDVLPNEKKTVELTFDRYLLCTYDYKNYQSYILEGGDYYFAVGNGAHEALNNIIATKNPSAILFDHQGEAYQGDTNAVQSVKINENVTAYKKSHYTDADVENQFDDADYNFAAEKNGKTPITYLNRQDWEATWPRTITTNPATNAESNMSQYYQQGADWPQYTEGDGIDYNAPYINDAGEQSVITFSEMSLVPLEGLVTDENSRFYNQEGSYVWDKFIKQMSLDDLIISISDNRGVLDVARVRKPGNPIAEGAEGLLAKFQYGDKRWATGFPTGPIYTGTWDHNMQQRYGDLFAEEALFSGVNCVNAPGCNINRTPFTSRASENMSEDGVMNYYVSANIVGKARDKGLIMNIGHCFLNNQETGRQRLFTYANEQAIREIYLKPFEGALTKGHGLGLQTSYNRIGARYAAVDEPLMNNVIREEWGYQGFIIDDPLTGNNSDSYANGPAMLHAGTDVFCLDGARGSQLKQWILNNNDGVLLRDLQRANKYFMYAMSRSSLRGYYSNGNGNSDNNGGSNGGNNNNNPPAHDSLITDEIRAIASSYDYDFDPNAVVIKEQAEWDFNNPELSSLSFSDNRDGYYLVYVFEGSYSEGYQGQYNTYYAKIYLWDDGLYIGKANNTVFRGYWFNSSLNAAINQKDCLNMVSSDSHYESIIASETGGFYNYQACIFLNPGWGDGRSIVVSGYLYYPDVAVVFDLNDLQTMVVGDKFVINSTWLLNRVTKHLSYTPIVQTDEISWNIPNGLLNSNNRLVASGQYVISATWHGLTASAVLIVTE